MRVFEFWSWGDGVYVREECFGVFVSEFEKISNEFVKMKFL